MERIRVILLAVEIVSDGDQRIVVRDPVESPETVRILKAAIPLLETRRAS